MYKTELEMYPDIIIWLEKHLRANFMNKNVVVKDSHSIKLSSIIESLGYQRFFPEYSTFEIYQDIVGFVEQDDNINMVFVECKLKQLSINAFSQIIGYSIIARPMKSYLISPRGMNQTLKRLLLDFNRKDILQFLPGKHCSLMKWDYRKKDIDYNNSIIVC